MLWALPALAAPPCTDPDNPCDPEKVCVFKASLAEKVALYQLYLRNSQVTKALGAKRDGVAYDGALYDQAVAQARAQFPDKSRAEQLVQAGVIFQEQLLPQAAKDTIKFPTCSNGGTTLNGKWLPKGGDGRYQGMTTTSDCKSFVKFCPTAEPCSAEGAGNIPAENFGDSDATSCPEFYNRDRAHEKIHQLRCQAAKARGTPQAGSIDAVIEEEIPAYEHSVKLTHAYLRLMTLQCSAMPIKDELRKRTAAVRDLLAPYLAK